MVHFLSFIAGLVGIISVQKGYHLVPVMSALLFLIVAGRQSFYARVSKGPLMLCVILGARTALVLPVNADLMGDCSGYIISQFEGGARVHVYNCNGKAVGGADVSIFESKIARGPLYKCVQIVVTGKDSYGFKGLSLDKDCSDSGGVRSTYYGILHWGSEIRSGLQSKAELLSDERVGGLGMSILFGASGVDRETKEKMKALGILHIMAVSGVNISYLVEYIGFVTKRFTYRIKVIVQNIPLIALFLLVGPTVSLIRAVLSFAMPLVLKKFGLYWKQEEIYLVLIIMLLVSPALISSYSFILVSVACFAIYVATPFIAKRVKVKRNGIVYEVLASVVITGMMLPVQYALFGAINVIGGAITLILSPYVELITIVGYLSIIFLAIPLIGDLFLQFYLVLISILLASITVSQ